jgi:hypothetical protein
MENKIETFVLGQISYNSLRHFILDRQLKTDDVVQVNTHEFDDLVLEYRDFYNSSMSRDIKILGIRIEESFDLHVRSVRVVSPVPEEQNELEYPPIGRLKWVDYFKDRWK